MHRILPISEVLLERSVSESERQAGLWRAGRQAFASLERCRCVVLLTPCLVSELGFSIQSSDEQSDY